MTATELPDLDAAPPVTDLFVPVYAPMREGDWELRVAEAVLCPGYWSPTRLVHGMAALTRHGRTWMSITPMEIESQEIGIRLARGHVAILGMGMGWAAAACAMRPGVRAVTVVERDADVLALSNRLGVFAQLPEAARAKLRVVRADALDWAPDAPVDLLMPDIWLPLVSNGRVAEVERMQARVGAAAVYFWGQEMEIARHAAAAGRAIDAAGIRDTIAAFGLPLIGPDYPGYAALTEQAARRWMRGRWLPGTTAPF